MTYTIRPHDTEEAWLDARYDWVTSTDVSALYPDVNPYQSARGLWLEKRSRKPLAHRENAYVPEKKYGRLFEPLVVSDFVQATCEKLRVDDPGRWTLFCDDGGVLACSVDRLVYDLDEPERLLAPLEVKNAWRNASRVWDVHVPPMYQFQAMTQMAVLGTELAYYGVWLHQGGPPVFRMHTIRRDEAVIADIRAKAAEFRRRVLAGDPPPVDGTMHTMKALTEEYRAPIELEVELADEFVDYRREIEELEAEQDRIEREIMQRKNKFRDALGNGTFGRLPDGSYCTWKADKNGKRTLRL